MYRRRTFFLKRRTEHVVVHLAIKGSDSYACSLAACQECGRKAANDSEVSYPNPGTDSKGLLRPRLKASSVR